MNILELSLALVALNLSALGFAISAFMVEQVNYLEIVLSVVGIISSVLAMALKFFDLDASLLRQAQREERALRQVVLQGVIMHVARTTHRTRLGQALGSFATRLAFIRRVRYQRRRVASSLFTHWLKKHMVKYPAVMVDLVKTVEYKARIKREHRRNFRPVLALVHAGCLRHWHGVWNGYKAHMKVAKIQVTVEDYKPVPPRALEESFVQVPASVLANPELPNAAPVTPSIASQALSYIGSFFY